MKTYFIRHTEKLDIDDRTFNNLLEKNLVAIHFPSLKESCIEESDTKSLNPEDYEYKAGKEAINSFLTLAKEGGYVCAEYRSLQGALIGKVSQNTQIQLLEGTWGDRNNLQGRKAILKILPLQNVKRISPSEYLLVSSGRPRQGTIKNWRNIGKRIEALVENNRLEPILPNLSPTQQEVLCSEFLRSEVKGSNLLPKMESLLLPVGRTLLDISINSGDVDENNHFTSLGNCGRRFLCLGKRD